MGHLYALNKSIMIQKTIIIVQKGSKIIFATEPNSIFSYGALGLLGLADECLKCFILA